METLRDRTVELILERLKSIDDEIMYIPDDIIEKVLQDCYLPINKLKKNCSTPEYLAHLKPNHPSEYDKFFMLLIQKVDARFALYATKRSLNKVSFRFGKLSQENRDKLFARLDDFGLFDNEAYFNAYKDIFKHQIRKREEETKEI